LSFPAAEPARRLRRLVEYVMLPGILRHRARDPMASELVFPVGLVHRKLGPGAVLAEALFFPELARLASTRERATDATKANLVDLITRLAPADLIRRRRAVAARVQPFTLTLSPPRKTEAWRDPLVLRFHAVVWDHPFPATTGVIVARIPELGIEVIADPAENLTEVLRREALAAVRRLNLSTGLRSLAAVQTTAAFAVEWVELKVPIPTLKERAIKEETEAGEPRKSVLAEVASPLGAGIRPAAFEADATVRQVAEALTAKPPQSVLLVGPSGVGKTAAVRELARRKADFALGATPFFQTSGARIVAGQCGFGMWEQRCQDLIKEAAKRRAVLHVGPLVELMDVGKSEHNHTGIATFLRPAIARGELLCVAECTPEQIPLIEKQDPQLLDAFRHVTVDEPDAARGKAILAKYAGSFIPPAPQLPRGALPAEMLNAFRHSRRLAAQGIPSRALEPSALDAIDRLHRRYATYSAYPGRPLRFLDNLIRDGQEDVAITVDEVYRGFTRETGLPRPLIDPAVPLDLSETHRWFSSRVVGQPEAVDLVVDLLATVKVGLTRPSRPIASLLFIGPTGVGKTEMAKELAEFLFGSRDRLTRFDMSEYADEVSVRRLVGGAFGSEGLLTAKVREQPFCVLLLDEVEKADPSVFDLLLQALGEARLTDAGGRLADFRNAVVILTSNLGAESYRKGSAGFVGSGPSAGEAKEHFTRAVEQFLRPEMFNRLDRVVPFAPLGTETIRRITDREWQKVLARDGVRFRGVSVNSSPALLDHLAAVGFDPRYGARPLKRAMERELLAPLARQMNRHSGDTPLSVEVGVADGRPAVAVRPIQGPRSQAVREPSGPTGKFATEVQTLRRWHQLVETCSVVSELNNDVYQLGWVENRILRKQARHKPLTPYEQEALAKLGRLRDLADDVRRQREAAFALEDAAVVAFHDGTASPPGDLTRQFEEANRLWDRLLLRLYGLTAPASDEVTLALFAEHRGHLGALASAYRTVAEQHRLLVEAVLYELPTGEPPPPFPPDFPPRPATPPRRRRRETSSDPPTSEVVMPPTAWLRDRLYLTRETPPRELLRRVAVKPGEPLVNLGPNTIGLAMLIAGPGAHVRFCGEAGLHHVLDPETHDAVNPDVLVAVGVESLAEYRPDEKLTRRGAIKAEAPRRTYELEKALVFEPAVDRMWSGSWDDLPSVLDPITTANMRHRLLAMILE
jgi:ATP-dependent Clp protease ATP-binding subunit ClpA